MENLRFPKFFVESFDFNFKAVLKTNEKLWTCALIRYLPKLLKSSIPHKRSEMNVNKNKFCDNRPCSPPPPPLQWLFVHEEALPYLKKRICSFSSKFFPLIVNLKRGDTKIKVDKLHVFVQKHLYIYIKWQHSLTWVYTVRTGIFMTYFGSVGYGWPLISWTVFVQTELRSFSNEERGEDLCVCQGAVLLSRTEFWVHTIQCISSTIWRSSSLSPSFCPSLKVTIPLRLDDG